MLFEFYSNLIRTWISVLNLIRTWISVLNLIRTWISVVSACYLANKRKTYSIHENNDLTKIKFSPTPWFDQQLPSK